VHAGLEPAHQSVGAQRTFFLAKTLPRVRTEMSLQVLAYNVQREITILGARTPIAEMRA
jgi:hypothetical protein